MPEISRFLGIVVYMYFNDHNPPHFHIKYNDYRAIIQIDNLAIIDGNLPPKVLSLVVEWASIHNSEIMDNWNSIVSTGEFKKIEPLV
jgi:hypothetical protein